MNMEFIEAMEELEKQKGISMDVLIEALEAALISAYKRNFASLQNVRVTIDRTTGEIKVYARKNVVEHVEDDRLEITLEDARQRDPRYELDDIVEIEVTPRDFGRIAAQTAKQVVVQRIREAERGLIYEEFSNREGDIVTGIVQRQDQKNIYIDLGKTEATLGPTEQIPGEEYRHGDRLKTYIVEVKKTTKGPQIMVSRTHPGLLKRLFELEVPEIHDGVVELKSVAREAGARSKVAVYSRDENVDPVGACVGPKGMRVQTIVNELKGEKIDIVKWSQDPAKFVANALSPAKVVDVRIFEESKVARVVVPDYQLSLAIGKEGQNARLAAKLTSWKIDIKSESQVEELIANGEYDDLQEQYLDEDFTSDDFDTEEWGEYSEDYDYNDEYEENYEEYEAAGEADYYDDESAEEGYSDDQYAEEGYSDDQYAQEYYDEPYEETEYSDENDDLEPVLEEPEEPVVVPVDEEEEKSKGRKSKKKSKPGDTVKKQAKGKRKKLSVEEVHEYLEELEDNE